MARVSQPRPSPSELVWADRDSPPLGPVPGGPRPTVAETAARINAGLPWRHAVRELLDGLYLGHPIDPTEPEPVDPQVDAYLAAVVEHICAQRAESPPDWVLSDDRFLRRFWWPEFNPAFQALCIVQSPAAFRRRGIFIGATTLHRV